MSVKSLIAVPEVRERLDDILPPIAKLANLPLKVPPRTSHYALVGTAFDYALRFELQRRNRHAIGRRWVAEGALEGAAAVKWESPRAMAPAERPCRRPRPTTAAPNAAYHRPIQAARP